MESRGYTPASSALGVNIWRLVRVGLAIFRFHTQAHHGQVIVGLCTITMFLNLVGKRIDNLSGTFETGMPEDVKQTALQNQRCPQTPYCRLRPKPLEVDQPSCHRVRATFAPIRLIMTVEFVAKIVNILEIEEDFEIFS